MSSRRDLKIKKIRHLRRKRLIRKKISGRADCPRLSVFRSHRHICCQLIDDHRGVTLAAASTLEKDMKSRLKGFGGNCVAAEEVGKRLAEKSLAIGIERVKFDRNGSHYHGRVKVLAEAARKAGLKF